MNRSLLLLAFGLALPPSVSAAAEPRAGDRPHRRVAVTTQLTLKVAQPRDAADRVIVMAEAAGGYLFALDEDLVRVKVPAAAVERVRDQTAALGTVIGRSHRAEDLGDSIDQLATRIRSRRSTLARYFQVLDDAGPDAVVTVERQIMRLVEELERMQGQLRVSNHRIENAELRVDFRAIERRPPAPSGPSPFDWINAVNLTDLYGDFDAQP